MTAGCRLLTVVLYDSMDIDVDMDAGRLGSRVLARGLIWKGGF